VIRKHKIFALALTGLLLTLLACNLTGSSTSDLTSFDRAHLMMLTSRAMLGLYDSESETASQFSGAVIPASGREPRLAAETLEEINQLKVLEREYLRMAELAERAGNTDLADSFRNKARYCGGDARVIDAQRRSWRYHHRFDNVIRRISRGLGHGIGEIITTTGDITVDSVRYTVKNYGDEIKQFIRNPVKYGINLAGQRQLDIIKHQFTDRLGPVLGGQVIRILRIDRISRQMESAIMGPDKQKTAIAEKTRVAASAGQEPATSKDPPIIENLREVIYRAEGHLVEDLKGLTEFRVKDNKAWLDFNAEGGAANGEILIVYTITDKNCPMSVLGYLVTFTGTYSQEQGFFLTGVEHRTSDAYYYHKEENYCQEFKEKNVISGRTFEATGKPLLNGEKFEITLTITEVGNPTNIGQAYLIVEQFGYYEPTPALEP